MTRVRRFYALPAPERHLFIRAVICLGLVKLSLRLFRFRIVSRLVTLAPQGTTGTCAERCFSPDRIARAVTAAGAYVPGAKRCLVQALAVQVLLSRAGYPARLRIGVTRNAAGEFQAHAWVETDGGVVVGGGALELERYTPLLALEARTA